MRNIFLFILIILSVSAFSQNPSNYQYRTVRERLIAMMVDSSFHVPRYNTTPSGLRVGSSQNSGALGVDTMLHASYFYSGGKWRNQGSFSFQTRLIHGGVVTWDSLLVFSVSAAYYEINGAFYNSSQTQITLDAADPTLDRKDLIYLDSTGAHKITGTPAANPAEPNLPVNSIRLTAIDIEAAATVPVNTVDTLVIYDQNVEWVGSTTSVTVDFDDQVNPYHFTKAASAGSITSSSIVKFTATSTINALSYETLRFWIKLKAQFNPNTYLQIYWTNGGVRASTSVDLTNGSYGFVRTFTSTYMQINIPVSSFGFNTSVGSTVDGLYFQSTGTNGSGYYLDWIQLQTGIPQAQPPAQNQRFGLEDVLASTNRAFNQNAKTFDWYNATVWQLASNNIIRIFSNQSSAGIFSPDGNNSVQATNTIAGLRIGASTNFVDAYADSTQAQKKISYNGNIHSTFGPFSHVTKKYADSVAAAFSGATGMAIGNPITSATSGSVLYAGTNGFLQQSNSHFFYDSTNKRLSINTTSPSSRLHLLTPSIGVTQSDANGLLLANNTAAAAGAQQMSPPLILQGNGWKTDATASSQDVRFKIDVLPVQGSGSPTGTLQIGSSVNGSAYVNRLSILSGGGVGVPNGVFDVTGNVTFNSNQFQVSSTASVANHYAAGSTSSAGVSLYHLPTRTWNADADGFSNFFGNPSVTEASSGAHKLIANVFVGRPNIINGTATTTNAASLYVLGSPIGTATVTNNYAMWVDSGIVRIDERLLKGQGADVASIAGAITLGTDGNTFEITGTNAITLISNVNWQNGSEITLIFTSTATLTDGTANSGTDIGMELAGNVNFVATADDVVTLVLCEIGGTQRWREKCRSVN